MQFVVFGFLVTINIALQDLYDIYIMIFFILPLMVTSLLSASTYYPISMVGILFKMILKRPI